MGLAHRALRSLLQGRLHSAALYAPISQSGNKVNFKTGKTSVEYTITFPQVTLLTSAESRRIFKSANPNKTIGFINTKERVLIIESEDIDDNDIFFVRGERYDVVKVDATSYAGYCVCEVRHTKGSSIFTDQLQEYIARGWKGSHDTQVRVDWLIRSIIKAIGEDWTGVTIWPQVGTSSFDSLYVLHPAVLAQVGTTYTEYGRGGGYPHILPTNDDRLASIFVQFDELMGRA